MIAEDEPALLRSLMFTLKRFHFKVAGFPDGLKVIEYLLNTENEKCDLLITDIQLPGISGLEVIDRLRMAQLQIPVLVMTAYGDQKVISEISKRKVSGFLPKPFSMDDLVNRVVQLLA